MTTLTPTIRPNIIYSSRNSPDSIARVGELIENDFPSVKIFTTNIRPPTDPPLTLTPVARIDSGRLSDLAGQLARHDGVLAVHAEDDEIVMYNYLLAQQRGIWDWYNVHLIHSKEVEDLAFRDAIRIAEQNGRRHVLRARDRQRWCSTPSPKHGAAACRCTVRY